MFKYNDFSYLTPSIGKRLNSFVSDNPSMGDGTCFLHEYMIPRGSTSFCLYDTRSLSDDSHEDIKMIKRWMTNGVRNGELVMRCKFKVHIAIS